MATIYKRKNSPFWQARYKLADGTPTWKTTGLTKKREAQDLAKQLEAEQIKLRNKNSSQEAEVQNLISNYVTDQNKKGFKPEAATKLITEIYAISSGKELKIPTLRRFLNQWLIDKKPHIKRSTYQTYVDAIATISRLYGGIGDKKLTYLEEEDLKHIQDKLIEDRNKKGTTFRTLNYKMNVLIRALKVAKKKKLIPDQIWETIEPLPEIDSKLKVPFTLDEIHRLLREATGDWKGMILLGAETGLRISNIAKLKWGNIDLESRCIKVKMVKQFFGTKIKQTKILKFTIRDSLMNCLKFLGTNNKGYVFQGVAKLHKDSRTKIFERIMKNAKLDKAIYLDDYEVYGFRSFNSLRHYFTSACANNNISQDVRKKYTGHSTDQANDIYTHLDPEVMRKELESLPEIKWEAAE